ncbi:MAG: hypothetical protein M3463_09100 [Verrucomicrobiota bacterium]|nr:hypothetical protein [Verrucomicrobiota bacterium]
MNDGWRLRRSMSESDVAVQASQASEVFIVDPLIFALARQKSHDSRVDFFSAGRRLTIEPQSKPPLLRSRFPYNPLIRNRRRVLRKFGRFA